MTGKFETAHLRFENLLVNISRASKLRARYLGCAIQTYQTGTLQPNGLILNWAILYVQVVVDAYYATDGKNCLRTDKSLYTGIFFC